jgi:hypothetical protein
MRSLRLYFVVCGLLAGSVLAQGGNYSNSDGAYPVQLALFPPVQLVPLEEDVAGLRLNLLGVNREVAAMDVGLVNWTTGSFKGVGVGIANVVRADSYGAGIGFFNYTEGNMTGFQGIPLLTFWNAFNLVGGRAGGVQGGLYNQAQELWGGQIGLVNVGVQAAGLQLSLFNYSVTNSGVQAGLVNIGAESAHGVQIGLLNQTEQFCGLQIGLVNRTRVLEGLQIGLLNIASEKEIWPVAPLANWVF